MLPIEVNPHLKSGEREDEREDGRRTRKSGSVSTPLPSLQQLTIRVPTGNKRQLASDLVVNPCLKSKWCFPK